MLTRNLWILIGTLWAVLVALIVFGFSTKKRSRSYYSLTERRLPCGRIHRHEVIHEEGAALWTKMATMMDSHGRVLASKTRTIAPEQCSRIQSGTFVPGLWSDCSLS